MTRSRCVVDLFFLLFLYTVNGTPLGDKPDSREIKYGYLSHYIPDTWGRDTEVAFNWPKGEVPYLFDESTYDDMLKAKLNKSMKSLEKESCVRFRELRQRPTQAGSWLHVTNANRERECSHTPTAGDDGEIRVTLGYECLKQAELTHALLHGLGFRDEVTHPKRDSFVKISWDSIQTAHWNLFKRYPMNESRALLDYDPKSIMHFHDHAFSKNGEATIISLVPGLKIAPMDNLSHLDKMKLRMMFGHECNKRKVEELLDTCQDLFSKNKNVPQSDSDSETLNVKPKVDLSAVKSNEQSATNSNDLNVVIIGHDNNDTENNTPSNNGNSAEQVKPGDSQTDDNNVDPQPPGIDDALSENSQNDENNNSAKQVEPSIDGQNSNDVNIVIIGHDNKDADNNNLNDNENLAEQEKRDDSQVDDIDDDNNDVPESPRNSQSDENNNTAEENQPSILNIDAEEADYSNAENNDNDDNGDDQDPDANLDSEKEIDDRGSLEMKVVPSDVIDGENGNDAESNYYLGSENNEDDEENKEIKLVKNIGVKDFESDNSNKDVNVIIVGHDNKLNRRSKDIVNRTYKKLSNSSVISTSTETDNNSTESVSSTKKEEESAEEANNNTPKNAEKEVNNNTTSDAERH